MIPEICANCATATNIHGEGGSIVGTVCYGTPNTLYKQPDAYCGMFRMAQNPQVMTEDNNAGSQEPAFEEVLNGLGDGDTES